MYIFSEHICTEGGEREHCIGDGGGSLVVQENDRFAVVGLGSWSGVGCPSSLSLPNVYARVTARKVWILENTFGTQDSNCAITTTTTTTEEPTTTEDSLLAKIQSKPDEDVNPLELIVGVSAAALVLIASIIVGICCWNKGKCGRRDTKGPFTNDVATLNNQR